MLCNQRGMALVSVVLIVTVLFAMAGVFSEKIWQSTRQAAAAANREQLFWAAQAGIEVARQQLTASYASYASSAGWQGFLTADRAQAYPAVPAWRTEVSGLPVEIYLRDNLDGDSDLHKDNDLKIFVLARARGRRGTAAMVESLCGFDLPAGASPAAAAASGSSQTHLYAAPVSSYNVLE